MSTLIFIYLFLLQIDSYSELTILDQVESRIAEVKDHRGTTLLILNSGEHFWIEHSRNYEYHPAYLSDFLQPSDLITKRVNSDTLLISRNSNIYTFVVGEFLNEHLSTETRIDLNFAYKPVILLGLFILMFGSYTRTTVLLTWNNYEADRSPISNIKNAFRLISSGHAKRGTFIFLLILFFGSTFLFLGTLTSIWISSR